METRRKIALIALVLLSLILAFILGRFSFRDESFASENEITIISASAIRSQQEEEPVQIRASSRGSKYYFPWCESTFSEENAVYFDSVEEAEKAGYEKASNCIDVSPRF